MKDWGEREDRGFKEIALLLVLAIQTGRKDRGGIFKTNFVTQGPTFLSV